MKDNELGTSRILNASREKVFKAYSDPDQLKEWWGPNGFKNTFSTFDFKEGGEWNFIMHGPDGVDYKNKMVFLEIKGPHKILMEHTTGPFFKAEATFEEVSPTQTKYSFKMIFPTKADCDALRDFVTEPNEQNIDRLESVLKK